MSSTSFSSSTNTWNRSPRCDDSAAPFVSQWCCGEGDFVHVGCVLNRFDGGSESACRADGMKHVDAGVTVRKATVVVGGDVQLVRVSNLEEFALGVVLIVDDEVPFHHFLVAHVVQFSSSFHFSEGGGRIAQESTPILVACRRHQALKSARELIVNAERDDFAHGFPKKPPFIIIPWILIISFC